MTADGAEDSRSSTPHDMPMKDPSPDKAVVEKQARRWPLVVALVLLGVVAALGLSSCYCYGPGYGYGYGYGGGYHHHYGGGYCY